MQRGYSKFLTVTLIIIVIAVIGLLGYLGYDFIVRKNTIDDAANAVDAFKQEAISEKPTSTNSTNSVGNDSITTNDVSTNNSSSSSSSSSTANANKKLYKNGFYMIGTIEIPKTGIKYPILEKVTKKSLETSVAVIWPENTELNKPGNVVIVGHNYRNGTFFSDNKKIAKNDKIYITDLKGNRVEYTVYKTFETGENDTSFYNRDTNGKMEITLSTCTDDVTARTIVQARAE